MSAAVSTLLSFTLSRMDRRNSNFEFKEQSGSGGNILGGKQLSRSKKYMAKEGYQSGS